MKNLIRSLTLAALALTAFALPTFAQQAAAAAANPCEEAARGDMYTNYYNKKKGDAAAQKEAYGIAKEYVQKYASCNDKYLEAVRKFVSDYNAAVLKLEFPKFIYGTDAAGTGRDLAKGYTVGKEILAAEPDDLNTIIALGVGGYLGQTSTPPNTSFHGEATNYAKQAIQLIESGKAPASWAPFPGKDETLSTLYYSLAEYMIKDNPAGAIPYYLKAASLMPFKNAAITYARLAAAYRAGQYDPMQTEFKQFLGQPETDESKHALNNLNQVIDRVMDAYARAISLAGSDPKLKDYKANWTEALTGLYKFRNNDTTTGLDAYIASVAAKPLPQPFTPQPYVPTATPTTGAANPAGDAGTGNGAMTSTPPATTSTTNSAPATTAAKPAAHTAPTPKPAPATKKP